MEEFKLCKKCGKPTPSRTRTCCDDCLSPGQRASMTPDAIAKRTASLNRPEIRAKKSASIKTYWESTNARKERSESTKRLWQSSDTRAKLVAYRNSEEGKAELARLANLQWSSSEAREAKSAEMKAKWESQDYRVNQMQALHSPEVTLKRNISLNSLETRAKFQATMQLPEVKAKYLAGIHSEAAKTKKSEAARQYWAIPEHRAARLIKLSSASKKRWERPEERLKVAIASAKAMANGKTGYKGHIQFYEYTNKFGVIIKCIGTWEYKVAQYLDSLVDILWEYETEILILDHEAYLPDFLLYDMSGNLLKIIEVKGYWEEANKAKTLRFQNWLAANGVLLEIWDKVKLKELGIL